MDASLRDKTRGRRDIGNKPVSPPISYQINQPGKSETQVEKTIVRFGHPHPIIRTRPRKPVFAIVLQDPTAPVIERAKDFPPPT